MPKGNKKRNARRKSAGPPTLTGNKDLRPVVPRPKQKRSAPSRSARPHHVRAACSVTDPFCPASKGSKWPDGTASCTLTEQFRGNTNISVDASGNSLGIFNAAAPFGYIGSTLVGTTATTVATATTYKASSLLASFGSTYRIVSFGCVVRNVLSATNSSGLVTFGTAPAPAVSTAYTIGTELYSEVAIKALQPGMEFAWISQPAGTGARDFIAQSTNTTFTSDWTSLWIEVSGAPASATVLNIEWFMNIEFNPLTTARSLTATAKPNPPKSDIAEHTTSVIHSSLGSFIEGGVQSVEMAVSKVAADALNSFAANPFDSLAALFF